MVESSEPDAQGVDTSRSVGVVLVNYRCLDLIATRLASGALAGATVMLVDNDSDAAAFDGLAARYDTLAIRMSENAGFAAAVNAAIGDPRMAQTEVTVLLNPDAEVSASDLSALVQALDRGDWDAVAPVMLDEQGAPWVSSAGGPVTLRSVIWYFLGISHLFSSLSGFFWTRRQVRCGHRLRPTWLCGAVLVVRRDAWERFGLLPTDELAYAEDTGWGVKASAEGARFALIRTVEVRHPGGASGGSASWAGATERLFVRVMGTSRGQLAVVTMRLGLSARRLLRGLLRRP